MIKYLKWKLGQTLRGKVWSLKMKLYLLKNKDK